MEWYKRLYSISGDNWHFGIWRDGPEFAVKLWFEIGYITGFVLAFGWIHCAFWYGKDQGNPMTHVL
jgi:hypothetical protein